jgi:hypothetical protein
MGAEGLETRRNDGVVDLLGWSCVYVLEGTCKGYAGCVSWRYDCSTTVLKASLVNMPMGDGVYNG